MLGGAGSPGGEELLTVTIERDEHGYGMKVSGDNPVYVQSVKEHGAAWRAGLRAGDRILRVDAVPVHHHTHQQVVHMIRANPTTVLTVQQNASRHKTPITAPVPVNSEKQRQLEVSKVHTMRLMLEQEQKYIRDLRNELSKVPDVRKQAQMESAEQRCTKLQAEIDAITAGQPCSPPAPAPSTPRPAPRRPLDKPAPPPQGFLSGLPRSLSNLTGQSLRNLRQARQKTQEQPPLLRQNSDETTKRRHVHNNTVPMVPTTCLDNVSPPPLPPRSIDRSRSNLSPPINPLAKPKPCTSNKYYKRFPEKPFPMHQSMPPYQDKLRRSSHSLDGELEGPQPNSIALQMNYPLVNAPPPPLQTDNRSGVPVLHVRSRSSPEQLDHEMPRPCTAEEKESWERGTPPPGTPPPPYAHNTQPCADPQRAIISMEEDDSPASDNSTYSGLFSKLRSVRESKARTAVLLNWLLGERRCACANLLLILTDGYRSAAGVPVPTLRRWAYEIQSTFLIPNAVLQLNGVDENMANEIEHVLVNEYDKEELLRNVFRKARQKAKEELSQQLTEFQVKRQVGLGTLYGPEDAVLEKCDVDKAQELIVVERLLCQRLSGAASGSGAVALAACGAVSRDAHAALLAALIAAALCLHCRPASVAAAVGGSRASFLQRDKLYKQRVKQLAKQHPQPYVVRGHHLQLQALTSVGHCHHCDHVIWGLAPQAYVCTDCKLRVHRHCAKSVEEGCCLDGEHHNNRISRFMERIHHNNQLNNQEAGDKKSRKASNMGQFLNMERSFRKMEDEQPWDQTLTPASSQGESRREGSAEEQTAPDADVDTSDATAKETPDKDNNWRAAPPSGRGVNRAESCRERDAPRRGKHRNASDPNRLTAHNNHDLEPGAATAPSGSSSSSSLSSRSNESNTVATEQQASQSDWSEEEEPLAAQWADSLPPHVLDALQLSARLRKRQEVIHELIVSEGSHVRWLKVLCRVFLRPLEAAPSLLPAEELRALFPNLPDVRDWHASLHAQLRALRSSAPDHVVQLGDLADTMLGTLGDAKYAACLSRFCRGQRLALEVLRERRRKNKDLHQFLASREQLPLCGRLQLRDLLACVWQRLTKYRLLLESVLKTVCEEEASSAAAARLRRALDEAKYMLNSVDASIRAAENEHRLRTIQSKLEVRVGGGSGGEWEELRRLDLTQHALRLEGDLSLRNDSSKKISMLALMFEEMLVLLQREGEKFILKPIPQPSQHGLLSPLIKWDKVLFRPNAAVRNTFFLMNINGIQMHELTANTTVEYTTWVNYIQEAPLAKVELKQSITPSHQASRSTDDSGINVSRNPSDASEKSNLTDHTDTERERDRASLDRAPERDAASAERDREPEPERDDEKEDVKDKEAEVVEKEEKHVPRRPTVGRISTHGSAASPGLEPTAAVTVRAPLAHSIAHTAETAYTYQERLRRLDEGIRAALLAKSAIVGAVLGVPGGQHAHLAELAVAETLGEVDVRSELRATRQTSRDSSDDDHADAAPALPDMRQLLLAAHAQANQLTETISRALSVNEAAVVASRSRRGRCNACRAPAQAATPPTVHHRQGSGDVMEPPERPLEDRMDAATEQQVSEGLSLLEQSLGSEASFDMLGELDEARPTTAEGSAEEALESNASAALLAARLSRVSSGLQGALGALLAALPHVEAERASLRAALAQERETADRLRAVLRTSAHQDYQMTDEIYFIKPEPEQPIQDQPSNGG